MRRLAAAAPFALLLGSVLYLFAQTLQLDYPQAPGRLGPDAWPQAILILLMFACALGILLRLLAGPTAAGAPASRSELSADDDDDGPARYGLVIGGILLFAAYPLALEVTGFLVATFLLMALLMWLGQWRNWLGIVTVSGVGTLALFYLFRGVVYISLPLGQPPFQAWTIWVAAHLGMH